MVRRFHVLSSHLFRVRRILSFESVVRFQYNFQFVVIRGLFVHLSRQLVLYNSSYTLRTKDQVRYYGVRRPRVIRFSTRATRTM